METYKLSGQVIPTFLFAFPYQPPGEMFYRLLAAAFLPYFKLHMKLKRPGTCLQGAETIPSLLLY